MKKGLKAIAVMISALACCTMAASGCAEGEEPEKDYYQSLSADPGYYVVNSFETLDDVRMGCNYYYFSGKASLCEDDEYVTAGKSSVKLEYTRYIDTEGAKIARPVFGVYSSAPYNPRLDKVDFTDVDRFSADVYNGSDEDITMTFGYSYQLDATTPYGGSTSAVLKSGRWNSVSIPFPRAEAKQAYDIALMDIFLFTFDVPEHKSGMTALYFDNFLAHKAGTPAGDYRKDRGNLELFSFDSPADMKAMKVSGIYSYFFGYPDFTFNADRRYVRGGAGSMKMTVRPVPVNPLNGHQDSVVFGFVGEDTLSGIRNFKPYEAVKFSYFNAGEEDFTMVCYISCAKVTYTRIAVLKPGMWTDVIIPVAELETAAAVYDGVTVNLDASNIRSLQFAYNTFQSKPPIALYLDEIVFLAKS